jgi:hypothetical protein
MANDFIVGENNPYKAVIYQLRQFQNDVAL